MNPKVSFNLQILPAENTFLNSLSSAALYGKGVFTTLLIYNSKPFLWEKHWRRLNENAARLSIELSDFNEFEIKNSLLQIIRANKLKKGRARITFFDETASEIWNFNSRKKVDLLMTTAEIRESKPEYCLTVSTFPINSKSPLINTKSCNYLENIIAFEDVQKKGFDEAVRLNEKGDIVSASMANIFWMKNGKLFTPPISDGCLAGTTREFLSENFEIEEKTADLCELTQADEIFLTSSGFGIKTIKKLEEKFYATEQTENLKTRFIELVEIVQATVPPHDEPAPAVHPKQ